MDRNRSLCEYPKWKAEKPQVGPCQPFVQFNYPIKRRKEEYYLLVSHIDNTTAALTSQGPGAVASTTSGAETSGPLSTTTLRGPPDTETTVNSSTISDRTEKSSKTCESKIFLFTPPVIPGCDSSADLHRFTVDLSLIHVDVDRLREKVELL
ncbi:MAG: hypothetical protein GY696_24520 [Gammaproteobacteria bacterium]|nr:hypothetical protein [Gammaproteobacteria bacterium]